MILCKRTLLLVLTASACLLVASREASPISADSSTPLLSAMEGELNRAMHSLGKGAASGQQPPYYLSYAAHEVMELRILAQYGAILTNAENRRRTADIIVRVGDAELDNTHGTHHAGAVHSIELPLANSTQAIARALWWGTNTEYANALKTYSAVKSEAAVRTQDEDKSPDFPNRKRPEFRQAGGSAHY